MLDHVGQKLEIINVADEIQAVHLRKADKYVLWEGGSQTETQTWTSASWNYNTCKTTTVYFCLFKSFALTECFYCFVFRCSHTVAVMQGNKWMLSYSQPGWTE